MIFSSSLFLFCFLPIVFVVYHICDPKYKNAILLLASILFYAWGEPVYVYLIFSSIIINYLLACRIEDLQNKKRRKFVFVLAMVFDLFVLIFFKYMNFFVSNLLNIGIKIEGYKEIALPIGISFFTFQVMSYVIDVYWGNVKAQRNCADLALYISMFPQLIAGPIVRYIDVENELKQRNHDKIYEGIQRFMIGFSKKVLLADVIAPLAEYSFGTEEVTAGIAWVGLLAYTLQIYFDFSGYSDMAIGLGKMFGFTFMENFDYPYISQSIQEFWRRWHISLSLWFRSYVYIPLGGSRCSLLKCCRNLLIVFLLTGFWHGANWNFIFWGVYYAVFLIAERIFLARLMQRWPVFWKRFYTMVVVMIGWVFFKVESLPEAFGYIRNLFAFSEGWWKEVLFRVNREYIFFLILGIVFSMPTGKKVKEKCNEKLYDGIVFSVFLCAILYMVGNGFSPFLYFRF